MSAAISDDGLLGVYGDERLGRVGRDLLAAMVAKRGANIRRLGGSRCGEVRFGRFPHNVDVSVEATLARAAADAGARAAGRDVLVIQDTTEINYSHRAAGKRGFGTVGNGEDIGLFPRPLLVLEASSGGVLGLAGCVIMNRRRRPATEASGL